MSVDELPPRLTSLAAEDRPLFVSSAKKSIAPTLTHQFEVVWPWPVGTAAAHETPQDTDAAAKADCCATDSMRRYSRPTHILHMTAEGHKPAAYGTRRVCLSLSPGCRFRLPLIATSAGVSGPYSGVFWRVAHTPPVSASASVPPQCAEVVIGEARAIEAVVRRRRESAVRRSRHVPVPRVLSRLVVEAGDGQPVLPEASMLAASVHTPVYTHWLRSVPYRVAFSQTWADTLFVSLPCEERLLTLRVPSRTTLPDGRHTLWSDAAPRGALCVSSLCLPRGVVPLDMAEVSGRGVVAVGTYEHGVVLCAVSEDSAALDTVLRTVSLAGQGSAVFPITRLAPLFPPPQPAGTHAELPPPALRRGRPRAGQVATPFFAWAAKAKPIAAAREGALLVSSPYEVTPRLVKLSDNRSGHGRQEDLPVVGTLGALQYVASDMSGGAERLVLANVSQVVALTSATAAEADDGTSQPRSEHVLPCVRQSVVFRHNCLLHRLADSPVVLYDAVYRKTKTVDQAYIPNHTRHFVVVVDGQNKLLLLDRNARTYTLLSSFSLGRTAAAAPESSPVLSRVAVGAGRRGAAVPRPKRRRPEDDDSEGTRVPGPGTLSCGLVEPDDVSDLCVGLAVVTAGDGWIGVAAAYDQHYVALVTWSAE